jgi:phospholipase C
LKGIGALAGSAALSNVLPGCSSSPPSTMVFMMMENRTYDHFLGSRSLVEGLAGNGMPKGTTNPDMNGNPVGLSVPPVTPAGLCVLDPPHEWDPSRVQFNNGANDGFVKAFQMVYPTDPGTTVMEYLTRMHLPVTYALADNYTTCDAWHASLLGPTLPNRLYWLAAQSGGAMSNDQVLTGKYTGFPTIFDKLDAAGVQWGYYYGDIAALSFFPQFANDSRVKYFMPDFISDAKAGKLPPVVFIDPSFSFNDYHPPHYPLVAEQLVSAAYTALATSPQWENCMFTLTFDEHGGFYDHVAPGTAPDALAAQGFNQLGFRVPAWVIGPKVKKGVVCSTALEHTSALRHIETVYKLEALTMRDAAANDLSDCIELDSIAAKPITLPTVEVDESMLGACSGNSLDAHIMIQWGAAAGMDIEKRQRVALDGVYAIGDYLDQHNLGRIRRGR